ncbi:MAG: VWA domain-containing protein [Bdellovibrionales bacterium]|nr:VWA domain-containing protein [Bdellovibrionales bacterium]
MFFSSLVFSQEESQNEAQQHYDMLSHAGWGNCLTSDIWVATDYSDSMEGYEEFVYQAARAIAKGLLKDNQRARLGIIGFNDEYKVVITPSNDLSMILRTAKEYKNLKAHGGTLMFKAFQAIDQIHDEIEKNPYADQPDYRKIIILISDGEDLRSEKTKEETMRLKMEKEWNIFSIFVHKEKQSYETEESFSRARSDSLTLLSEISGNSTEESSYVDSVLLEDLPDFFRNHFSCM